MKRFVPAIISLCAIIPLLSSCSGRSLPPPPAKHVDVAVVYAHDVPYIFDYPAIVQGVVDYTVIPRISGAIFKQYYTEGTYVHKDDVLYQIDPRPYQLQLANWEGQLVKDQAAADNYKLIYDRYVNLYKTNAVSLQDVETADINYKMGLGNVKTDTANIDNEKLNLEYCLVRAPADGYVAERQVTVGEMVTAWQTVLNHINSVNDMYIEFSMPENDRLTIENGVLSGKIKVPAGYKFRTDLELADGSLIKDEGYVEFADTRISLENGVWNLRAYVDNLNLEQKLLAGQFIHIYLNGAVFVNTYAVPQVAVFRDDQGSFVYVVAKGDQVLRRQVTAGKMIGDQWIIESGLHDGDEVVVNGGIKVNPGDKVVIDSITKQIVTPPTVIPTNTNLLSHKAKIKKRVKANAPAKAATKATRLSAQVVSAIKSQSKPKVESIGMRSTLVKTTESAAKNMHSMLPIMNAKKSTSVMQAAKLNKAGESSAK